MASSNQQIQRMVAFMKQEAKEKADEIDVQTDYDFEIQKQNLYNERRAQIDKEFEESRKRRLIQQKIARSKEINDARLDVMKVRNNYMNQTKAATLKKLAKVSSMPRYGELITWLIAQGLMTIMEPEIQVRCRKEDADIVKAQLPKAVELFHQTMQAETGVKPLCTLTLDETEFLPPGPREDEEGQVCHGGVILVANDGKIICRNTLEARLDLVFQQQFPLIRGKLFGFREKAADIVVPSEKTALIRE